LLSAPARVDGPAYALTPLPGVPSLGSLDRRSHWDRNQAAGQSLAHAISAALAAARLAEWLAEQGLPAVDPLRMSYHRGIIVECIRLADLLMRLDDLLRRQSPQRLIYSGPAGWRGAALKALCAARGIAFEWRRSGAARASLTTRLRAARRYLSDLADRAHNRRLTPHAFDYLALARTSRFSLGLFPILQGLKDRVRVIEERTNPAGWQPPHEVWRLEGGQPWLRTGSTRIEAALRARIIVAARAAAPLLWQDVALNEAAGLLVSGAMEGVVAHIQAMQAVLRAHPRALLVTTPVGEQYLEVARAMGREVAVVQTCGIWEYENNLPGSGHYLLTAEADADYLTQRGVARERITVCGHPYYDELRAINAEAEAATLRARLGVGASQSLILLIGSHALPGLLEPETLDDLFGELMRGLAGALQSEDAVVLLKPHPVDRGGALLRRHAEASGLPAERLRILDEPSITPLIAACDLMVMMNSTVALEAFLFDKPVINISYTATDTFDFIATGAVWPVHSAATAQAAVLSLLHDPAAQRALREGRARFRARHLHAQDGHAAARATSALRVLARLNEPAA